MKAKKDANSKISSSCMTCGVNPSPSLNAVTWVIDAFTPIPFAAAHFSYTVLTARDVSTINALLWTCCIGECRNATLSIWDSWCFHLRSMGQKPVKSLFVLWGKAQFVYPVVRYSHTPAKRISTEENIRCYCPIRENAYIAAKLASHIRLFSP